MPQLWNVFCLIRLCPRFLLWCIWLFIWISCEFSANSIRLCSVYFWIGPRWGICGYQFGCTALSQTKNCSTTAKRTAWNSQPTSRTDHPPTSPSVEKVCILNSFPFLCRVLYCISLNVFLGLISQLLILIIWFPIAFTSPSADKFATFAGRFLVLPVFLFTRILMALWFSDIAGACMRALKLPEVAPINWR